MCVCRIGMTLKYFLLCVFDNFVIFMASPVSFISSCLVKECRGRYRLGKLQPGGGLGAFKAQSVLLAGHDQLAV